MPRLSNAEALYFGAAEVDEVRLGSTIIWPTTTTTTEPPGGTSIFGFPTVVGSGMGFPGSADRALGSLFNKANSGTVTKIFARFRNDTVAGATGKICAFTNASGTPGSRIWVSQAVAIPAAGGIVEFGLPDTGLSGTNAAGNYFLIFVPNNFQANLAKSDSAVDGSLVMANGTFSYSSPPASWPGTSSTYDGPGCIWCEYAG